MIRALVTLLLAFVMNHVLMDFLWEYIWWWWRKHFHL